ncbi:MAG: hypothetical protein ABI655_05140 [Phenylobacterium sp.]
MGAAESYAPTLGTAEAYHAVAGQATDAQAGSLLDNLGGYMSPYRRDVVDSALNDYDFGAGQTRAQQDLDLAGSGAFGGSGAALTRSMTEDALTRGRATTSANLYDQMFQRGAALSADDANRRQQVSLANAAAANQFGLANMEALNQAGQFNAGARNQFGLANAEAMNQAGQFNTAAHNQFGLANMDALNQAGQFNTSARNQFELANMASANDAGRFNAEANDRTLQRQMDAARGLTDLSTAYDANQRANIAAQAGIGDTLRGIDQQQRQAPVTSTQQIVAMLSGLPISLFTGEQKSGTESGSSTGKTSGLEWGASASFTKIPGVGPG